MYNIFRFLALFSMSFVSFAHHGWTVFENIQWWSREGYINMHNMTYTRLNVENSYTTTYVTGSYQLLRDVNCDHRVQFDIYAKIRGVFNSQPTFSGNMRMGDLLDPVNVMKQPPMMRTYVIAYEGCFRPKFVCPMLAGSVYTVDGSLPDCRMSWDIEMPSDNPWNISFTYGAPGEQPYAGLWWVVTLDNTHILKAKRPSTVQKRRQRGRNKSQPKN